MSCVKRSKTSHVYIGVVTIYHIAGEYHQSTTRVGYVDIHVEHWLVELLVRLFPEQVSFGWAFSHVSVSRYDEFDVSCYPPIQTEEPTNTVEFINDDILKAFRAHPIYNTMEIYNA